MKTEHPKAALLRAIADGEQIQVFVEDRWVDCSNGDIALWHLTHMKRELPLRIKPKIALGEDVRRVYD